jgi:hypothetical protein
MKEYYCTECGEILSKQISIVHDSVVSSHTCQKFLIKLMNYPDANLYFKEL